jgi:methylase of polypeptide subunit release factors
VDYQPIVKPVRPQPGSPSPGGPGLSPPAPSQNCIVTPTLAPPTLLEVDAVTRLREALLAGNYTTSHLQHRLGPIGADLNDAARNAVLSTMGSDDPTIALLRLFGGRHTLPASTVEAVLNPLPLADALAEGLVEQVDGGVRARVSIAPIDDDRWLISDFRWSTNSDAGIAFDHVLGRQPSAELLARLTIRRPVETALDLGIGSGLQAMRLSRHAARVTGTDISNRALRFARTNAALNGLEWELLEGDLAEPVWGRRFDLVVSNPPFVVSVGKPQHRFRDAGREGDALSAELIAAATGLLAPGGTMQFLASWVHVAGQPIEDRLAGWAAGTGLDAWFLEIGQMAPRVYVAQWIASEDPAHLLTRAADWLGWFQANKVAAIGHGIVILRASGHDDPIVRILRVTLPAAGLLGDDVADWLDRCDLVRGREGSILDARLRCAEGTTLTNGVACGPHGWGEVAYALDRDSALPWKVGIGSDVAALLRAADGTLPLREHLHRIAEEHNQVPETLAGSVEPIAMRLEELGFLVPAEEVSPGPVDV